MAKELILDEQVGKDLSNVKKVISRALPNEDDAQNLYQTTIRLLSDSTRSNQNQLSYLESYEKAVSVFREASITLRQAMDTQTLVERLGVLEEALRERVTKPRSVDVTRARLGLPAEEEIKNQVEDKEKTQRDALKEQITEAVSFSNRYALYFAGQVGLALLNGEKAKEIDGNRFFFGAKYEAVEDRDGLASLLSASTTKGLRKVVSDKKSKGLEVSDDDLKYTLECVFTSWIDQFRWNTFKDVAKKQGIEDVVLKYDNFSTREGEFSRKYDVVLIEGKFMNVKVTDLIEQEEHTKRMQQLLYRLLAWDEQKRDNPFSPPTVVAIHGSPGCGKTMSANAYVNWFIEVCKELKKPLLAIQHSIDDYGSKYQNDTPIKLAARRDKIRDFPGVAVLQASDVDTFMPEARSKEPTQEENKVNGIYFSMFDNSRIPYGKFMAILDANHVDNIDPALKSRFGERIELTRFGKPESFAKYAKIYLTKNSQGVGINEADWLKIGKYLLESNLSNREIANVINTLRGGFEVTPELLTRSYDEQVTFRNNYLKSITYEVVTRKFDEFLDTTQEIERQSIGAKIEDRKKRYLIDLATKPEDNQAGSQTRGA
jgi:SpoVK/Ycf46/Vps4 family AAA+-type ATPase